IWITGKTSTDLDRFEVVCQDRHAVPRLLSMPDRSIPSCLDRHGRKNLVGCLEFLQAHDIGCFALQPLQQVLQPRPDSIDIESGDFHFNLSKVSCFYNNVAFLQFLFVVFDAPRAGARTVPGSARLEYHAVSFARRIASDAQDAPSTTGSPLCNWLPKCP